MVADPDASRVEFVQSFTEAEGASSLEAVLARDDVDVVSLCHAAVPAPRPGVSDPAGGEARRLREAAGRVPRPRRRASPRSRPRPGSGSCPSSSTATARACRSCCTSSTRASPAGATRSSVEVAGADGPSTTTSRGAGSGPPSSAASCCRTAVHALDMVTYVAGPADPGLRPHHHPRQRHRDRGLRVGVAGAGRRRVRHPVGHARLARRDQPAPLRLRAPLAPRATPRRTRTHRDPWTFIADDRGGQAAIDEALSTLRAAARGLVGPVRAAAPTRSTPGTGPPVTLADARCLARAASPPCTASADAGVDVALPLDAPTHAALPTGWLPDDRDLADWTYDARCTASGRTSTRCARPPAPCSPATPRRTTRGTTGCGSRSSSSTRRTSGRRTTPTACSATSTTRRTRRTGSGPTARRW